MFVCASLQKHAPSGRILLLAFFFAALLLTGCTRPFEDRAKDTSVFRFSENGAPVTMDPVQSSTQYANLMTTTIYDQLYEYKYLARPYELKPRLAVEMPDVSENGRVYTIQIRKGVFYTDNPCFPGGKGREVVAGDLIYSIKRMFDPKNIPQGAWLWQGRIVGLDEWKAAGSDFSKSIEGLTALDPYTLQITLIEPYPQLIYTLAMGYSSFVPREAVDYYGAEFGIHPVGSGPYKLVSFSTKKANLVRNPKYRAEYFDLAYEGYDSETQGWANLEKLQGKKTPIMDQVEVHFMSQSMTRWNSLNKGNEIQLGTIPIELTYMVAEELSPLKLKQDYAAKFTGMNLPQFEVVYMNFNMSDPAIGFHSDPEQNHRNLLLRRAIRYGYNWEQRNRRFYNNIAHIFPGTIPMGLDAHDEALPRDSITLDIEKAKALLSEGGWTTENLPVLNYCSTSSVTYKQFYEQFRGWMEKIGYPREKVTYTPYATFGDYSRAVKQRECMLIGMAWGLDYPDSENILQLFYGPNQSPGSNSSNFDNPQYNNLFEKAKTMQPGPLRTDVYRELNEIIIDEAPSICGLSRNSPYIWHKNVVYYPSRSPHGSLLKYAYVFDPGELEND